MRPGEKLYEEVQHLSEELKPTEHPRVLRFVAQSESTKPISSMKDTLNVAIASHDNSVIKQAMREFVPEYKVFGDSE